MPLVKVAVRQLGVGPGRAARWRTASRSTAHANRLWKLCLAHVSKLW